MRVETIWLPLFKDSDVYFKRITPKKKWHCCDCGKPLTTKHRSAKWSMRKEKRCHNCNIAWVNRENERKRQKNLPVME